jgi:hypothetical protein
MVANNGRVKTATFDYRRLLFFVARLHRGFDIAAHVEVAFDPYAQWIAGVHKIFEDHIDDVFVKDLHVPKRIDVELQTFQFDAALVRSVFDTNGREVRKVRKRTDAGEFRDFEINFDLASGELIGESIERVQLHLFAWGRANVESLLINRLQFAVWGAHRSSKKWKHDLT